MPPSDGTDTRLMVPEGTISVAEAAFTTPPDFLQRLEGEIQATGGQEPTDPEAVGSIGRTMFDLPSSEDGTVTVLLPQNKLPLAPSQALMRIKSREGKSYIGIVTAGPFAEPDSIRGDSPMITTIVTRGGDIYLPPYHGRVQVSIMGEEQEDGTLGPPRLRPLPNSRVFALSDEESAAMLQAGGDIRLGLVVGHDNLPVGVPSDLKSVLPRHTAVLGTTGSGKSTTIARLVQQAQAAGMAVILLDVEGEYTFLHEPTADPRMLTNLAKRGISPAGIPADTMTLYHLVGRESANPRHPHPRTFSLQFARLSPYTAVEILGLNDAQTERFFKAYDVAKVMMRELNIFPEAGNGEHERFIMDIDEFERGYPRLTLSFLIDIVSACLVAVDKKATTTPHHSGLQGEDAQTALKGHIAAAGLPAVPSSWRALLGRLGRLNRLKVFDTPPEIARPLIYRTMLQPGAVSVIDLSDAGMSELSNIVIADLLRGVQEAQDDAYTSYEKAKQADPAAPAPTRVLLIIEEAHEFLSAERAEKMPILFQQVARIAKRGRKRWLGLVFVTQLPQHLPRQIFGLVNSYIVHKLTDPQVVSTLQRTVSGIDESLWRQVPSLAPGQAIVSFPHMTRPLLVSIDPAPAQLRLID